MFRNPVDTFNVFFHQREQEKEKTDPSCYAPSLWKLLSPHKDQYPSPTPLVGEKVLRFLHTYFAYIIWSLDV